MIISLSQGKETIIDSQDYDLFGNLKWYYTSGGYAARRIGYKKKRMYYLHREILKASKEWQIDHINGNKLEFWCIFKGMENRSKKVKYRYAKDLAKEMNRLGRKDLGSKCYQFIKNIYSEEQATLT